MAGAKTQRRTWDTGSEIRFWTVLAVVLALLSQVLFPPHLLAASPDSQGFVLCNTEAPQADQALNAAVAAEKNKKADIQGLKCVDCVLASLTGLPQPDLAVAPVVYRAATPAFLPSRAAERPQARAPPRPHSCGPPVLV